MRRLICLLCALIAQGAFYFIDAQDVKLDLTSVDTGVVVVTSSSFVFTDTTDTIVSVPVISAGAMEMQIKHEETSHSLVRFDVNSEGVISNVEWKADLKDTTSYVPLDTGRYELKSGDTELKLKGCDIFIDLEYVDYEGFQVEYLDPVTGESSFFGDPDENGSYSLFPGNYRLVSTASNAAIGFLVLDDCTIDSKVYWKLGLEAAGVWSRLHLDFYEVETNTLRLFGYKTGVKIALSNSQTAAFSGFKAGEAAIGNWVTNEANITPGRYRIALAENDEESIHLEFEMLNVTGRLSPIAYWNDILGSETGGQMVALEPGLVYFTPETLESGELPPPDLDGELPYAVLKDKLDAGYYLAIDGELRLRYDERYEENLDLNLRILDDHNVEVNLSSPVARQYGSNWIQLNLPTPDFTVGAYYVLEVRSEKGDLSMLRFRYD